MAMYRSHATSRHTGAHSHDCQLDARHDRHHADPDRHPAPAFVVGTPRTWLRLEGLAAFALASAAFLSLGGPPLLLVPLLLAVDISMAGYLANPRVGAFTYNLAHQWATGLAVLGAGWWLGSTPLLLLGTVLAGHVGMDLLSATASSTRRASRTRTSGGSGGAVDEPHAGPDEPRPDRRGGAGAPRVGGLDAVTMAAIADRVGVKPASLYKHVRDRPALIGELVEATAVALGQDLAAGDDPAATPRTRLTTLGRGYRAFAMSHPRATALLFADLGAGVSLGAHASRTAAGPVLGVAAALAGPDRALRSPGS